jgi:rare lipoprotein A
VKTLLLFVAVLSAGVTGAQGGDSMPPKSGLASWYGEAHRGRTMANGRPFNPDKLTAASWFYRLGTKVRVTVSDRVSRRKSIMVVITDRGPAPDLVREGRIIDLGHATFKRLADPDLGLISVSVEPVR